ncbi:MAG: ABC transporter permease [Acidimicrobiaceae bacterium]|nr:ABC transporter permease [Acidimicrobiaceae bacterium]
MSAAGRGPAAAIGATAGLVYLFFYLPVLVLVLFSFNEARTGGRWTGFTTAWYARLADNDQIRSATVNSILIAVIATALAVVVGTMLSLALDRHAFRGRRAAEQVVYLPVIAPEIVTGVSLLAFFSFVLSRLNDLLGRGAGDALRLGRPTVVIAHVAFCTAFVALVVRASLLNFDPVVEEAARDLGASRWTTFWRVTLPSIAPGVLGGALLSFTLSLDNFVITFFVAGPGATTLPIEVFGQLRRSISPEVNAVSTLIFAASTLLLVGALAIQAGAARRRLLQFRQDGRPGGEAALLDPQHSPQHTWEET